MAGMGANPDWSYGDTIKHLGADQGSARKVAVRKLTLAFFMVK
jgi:hypothetical protein